MGELTSVEVIYSNIAETHDAITKRLNSGINALGLNPIISTDAENNHVEIFVEPSDDPTSQTLKRMVVFVTNDTDVTAVLLEGNISIPEEIKAD